MGRVTGVGLKSASTYVLTASDVFPQMVSCATLAFVAASLVAVASAAAPDINVVVGNFALNLVSMSCTVSLDPPTQTCRDPNGFQDGSAKVSMTKGRGDFSTG